MESNLNVEVVTDQSQLGSLEPWWKEAASNPETHPDYIKNLLTFRDSVISPYIVVVRRGQSIETMLIARLEDDCIESKIGNYAIFRKKARLINIAYRGLIGTQDDQSILAILRKIDEDLEIGVADFAVFTQLREESISAKALNEMSDASLRIANLGPSVHHLFKIPDTPENVLGRRSGSHRKKSSYYRRKAEREIANMEIVEAGTAEQLDQYLPEMDALAEMTYQRAIGAGFRLNAESRGLIDIGLKHRWIRVWLLNGDDGLRAFAMGLNYAGTFNYFTPAYDPNYSRFGLGSILLIHILEQLSKDQSIEYFDFGFGDADYKKGFSTTHWIERTRIRCARRISPTISLQCLKMVMIMDSTTRKFLEETGLKTRVRRMLRGFDRWRNSQSQ